MSFEVIEVLNIKLDSFDFISCYELKYIGWIFRFRNTSTICISINQVERIILSFDNSYAFYEICE